MMSVPSGPFQTPENMSTPRLLSLSSIISSRCCLLRSSLHLDSGRDAAIVQVIQRLDEIGPNNQHSDRLYAISAIGKRWRASYALKGRGSKGGQLVKVVAEAKSLRSTDQIVGTQILHRTLLMLLRNSVLEFVGGCDIILGMHQSGKLEDFLEKHNIIPKVQTKSVATPSSSS